MSTAPPSDYRTGLQRAQAWVRYMEATKGVLVESPRDSMRDRYERLRERYVSGSITLEDFTVQVVILLKEGF